MFTASPAHAHNTCKRAHGIRDDAVQQVFMAVIITKVCCASSGWWRFTSTAVRQHLEAFLYRSRLCPPDEADLTKLVEAADDTLFQRIISNDNHVLFSLLPPQSDSHYELR